MDDDYAAMIDQLGLDNPCNCEHEDHWGDDPNIHDHRAVPASRSWTALYVGPVCIECGMTHMSDWLVRHGPYMEDGKFVSVIYDTPEMKLYTVDEIEDVVR